LFSHTPQQKPVIGVVVLVAITGTLNGVVLSIGRLTPSRFLRLAGGCR